MIKAFLTEDQEIIYGTVLETRTNTQSRANSC